MMIFSRFLISDTHRSRSPSRWLSDLARRAFPFSPTGQEPRHLKRKSRHLRENLPWDLTVVFNGVETQYKVAGSKNGWTHYVPR